MNKIVLWISIRADDWTAESAIISSDPVKQQFHIKYLNLRTFLICCSENAQEMIHFCNKC